MGLRAKGETAEEIAGAAQALRCAMVRLEADDADALVDTCGTGGGRVGTLNISTAAASWRRGPACRWPSTATAATPRARARPTCSRRWASTSGCRPIGPASAAAAGLVFLFAPTYHPAMRHVGPVRKELGVPTIMNLLGPLANPAGVAPSGRRRGRPRTGAAGGGGAGAARGGARAGAARRDRHGRDQSVGGDPRLGSAGWGGATVDDRARATIGLECDDLDGLAGGEPGGQRGPDGAAARRARAAWSAARCCSTRQRRSTYRVTVVVRGGGWRRARGTALDARGGAAALLSRGCERRPAELRWRPRPELPESGPGSVLADDPDHDALDQHIPLLEAHGLHGGVGRLEPDPTPRPRDRTSSPWPRCR